LRVVFHNVAVLPINVRLFPENNKKIQTYFVKYQLIDRIQETLYKDRKRKNDKMNSKHSVKSVFDFKFLYFLKENFQKLGKHSESIWSF